ncbi:hypothetical protein Pan153_43340 [Gimesia panareensis]|uniref:Uncharacterized protein n=1 Tax=Gimesia panareensis TaxID=2527978 RepID=A0A518FTK3_9PLAN|nr:hypothetical protein Pan153_43340 [Gimesia panareensis]
MTAPNSFRYTHTQQQLQTLFLLRDIGTPLNLLPG